MLKTKTFILFFSWCLAAIPLVSSDEILYENKMDKDSNFVLFDSVFFPNTYQVLDEDGDGVPFKGCVA